MAVPLLERDTFLHSLDDLLGQVDTGQGRIALISGEAGIGKTSLVEAFLQRQPATTRVLWGTCEALFTPRPLGPLYDIVYQTPSLSPLRALLEGDTNRATLFAAVYADFSHPSLPGSRPTIIVIEDIHWADEATLDLIKFLARRIHRGSILLILTYRDDELHTDHPLRFLLGDLPSAAVCRLHLPPLSETAVTALAHQARRSAADLYAVTSGNPFFVVETLAGDTSGVPNSVSDVVLAQVGRRSPEARRLLELVAVVPTRAERWLIEAATVAWGDVDHTKALEECLTAHMLRLEDGAVRYRHELARQAVGEALSSARRRELHAQVLHLLLERGGGPNDVPVSLARLVHHAAEAEDGEWVLRLAPDAARQAAAQGAHREAVAHYQRAIGYASMGPLEPRADLLDALAYECYLCGQMEEAIQAGTSALSLWRDLKQTEKIGHSLRQLICPLFFSGRDEEAVQTGLEAVELLETLPPGRELALAYQGLAGMHMVNGDTAGTVLWGARSLQLAEQLNDTQTICTVLNDIGCAELNAGLPGGRDKLERSLRLGLEHEFEWDVARAYNNLADADVQHRNYTVAFALLQEGVAYIAEHGLEVWEFCLRARWAQARLDQGDWIGAEEEVTTMLSLPQTAHTRQDALRVLGLVRARRGDPGAEAAFDEARDLALTSGEMQCIAPVAAARAEWRWLQGDCAGCVAEATPGFQMALAANYPWHWSEVAMWLWRGGALHEVPERTPEPFARQMAGDWRGAAAAWELLRCPYEQALALLDGDEPAQRQALDLFERLGARPAAEQARRRLRLLGVRSLPRGPRPATLANPHGLTPRQLEILQLLAGGLHNSEIADRLSTTNKTVEHHVSAVLAKLGARTRTDAVRLASDHGLISSSTPAETPAATPR